MDSLYVNGSRLFFGQMPGFKKKTFEIGDIVKFENKEHSIKVIAKKIELEDGTKVSPDDITFIRRVYK